MGKVADVSEKRKSPKTRDLTPSQKAVLAECPKVYQPTFHRAFSGISKTAAIRAFCLSCAGHIRAEIKNCTAYGCPLFPYRPFQNSEADDDR